MAQTKDTVVCAHCGRTINLASSNLIYGAGGTIRICRFTRPTSAGNQKCDELGAAKLGIGLLEYHKLKYGF
jgi:hypothetical protein